MGTLYRGTRTDGEEIVVVEFIEDTVGNDTIRVRRIAQASSIVEIAWPERSVSCPLDESRRRNAYQCPR